MCGQVVTNGECCDGRKLEQKYVTAVSAHTDSKKE